MFLFRILCLCCYVHHAFSEASFTFTGTTNAGIIDRFQAPKSILEVEQRYTECKINITKQIDEFCEMYFVVSRKIARKVKGICYASFSEKLTNLKDAPMGSEETRTSRAMAVDRYENRGNRFFNIFERAIENNPHGLLWTTEELQQPGMQCKRASPVYFHEHPSDKITKNSMIMDADPSDFNGGNRIPFPMAANIIYPTYEGGRVGYPLTKLGKNISNMFCPMVSYMTEASSRWYGDMLKERTLMERFCDEDRENALADYYNYIALSVFLDTPGSVEYDTVTMGLIEYLLNNETEVEAETGTRADTGAREPIFQEPSSQEPSSQEPSSQEPSSQVPDLKVVPSPSLQPTPTFANPDAEKTHFEELVK